MKSSFRVRKINGQFWTSAEELNNSWMHKNISRVYESTPSGDAWQLFYTNDGDFIAGFFVDNSKWPPVNIHGIKLAAEVGIKYSIS